MSARGILLNCTQCKNKTYHKPGLTNRLKPGQEVTMYCGDCENVYDKKYVIVNPVLDGRVWLMWLVPADDPTNYDKIENHYKAMRY